MSSFISFWDEYEEQLLHFLKIDVIRSNPTFTKNKRATSIKFVLKFINKSVNFTDLQTITVRGFDKY